MKYKIIYIITLLIILSSTFAYSQVRMKPSLDNDVNFKICIVNDSIKADVVVFIVKLRSTNKHPFYWIITTNNKKYDYTYKVVSCEDSVYDFSVYFTDCYWCANIRNKEKMKKFFQLSTQVMAP